MSDDAGPSCPDDPDCTGDVVARGLCMKHYQRQRRNDDATTVRKRGVKSDHDLYGSPEYSSWQMMKQRCLNPKATGYARYGGAGITIWPEWITSFSAFYAHVGPRPEGTSLDRYPDKNGNYEPGNVRWATRREQNSPAGRRSFAEWS